LFVAMQQAGETPALPGSGRTVAVARSVIETRACRTLPPERELSQLAAATDVQTARKNFPAPQVFPEVLRLGTSRAPYEKNGADFRPRRLSTIPNLYTS
jgi:hypothetical protein